MSDTCPADNHALPALILAGGRSSRMVSSETENNGTAHKALLDIGGATMLRHIVQRLTPQVSCVMLNGPADFPDPHGLRLVPDTLGGQVGPLAGVLAGLRQIIGRSPSVSHLLSVPSDSPFFPDDLAARLRVSIENMSTIVIATSNGRSHPVFGLWPTAIANDLQSWLGSPENRRITAFLQRYRVVTVDFPMIATPIGRLDPFFNINTPDDLSEARRFAEALA